MPRHTTPSSAEVPTSSPPAAGRPGTGPVRSGARRLARTPAASSSAEFAAAVRVVAEAARRRGLSVPVFRSPPGLPELDRSLRRTASGTVVAIRLGDRPVASIQADVVDGVVVANRLSGREASGFRRAAWAALGGSGAPRPPREAPVPVRSVQETDPGSASDARVA